MATTTVARPSKPRPSYNYFSGPFRRAAAACSTEGVDTTFLSSVPLFATLGEEDLDLIASMVLSEPYASGETIIKQGVHGDRFYMVVKGEAVAYRSEGDSGSDTDSPDGAPFMRYRRGAYFGEVSLLTDQPRGATVRAVNDCEVAYLTRDDFGRLPEATRNALELRMELIYNPNKGLSVVLDNDDESCPGMTRVTISTVALEFEQATLLSRIIAECKRLNLRVYNANVTTERATGRVLDTFDITSENGEPIPADSMDAVRSALAQAIRPQQMARSTLPAIFGQLPTAEDEGTATGRPGLSLMKERVTAAETLVSEMKGIPGVEKLEKKAKAARKALDSATLAIADVETIEAKLLEADGQRVSARKLKQLKKTQKEAQLRVAEEELASEEAAADLERLIVEIEASAAAAAATKAAPTLPMEMETEEAPAKGAVVEETPPEAGPCGTGYEIILQAFNWESWRQPYWENVSTSFDELAGQGFTAVWLPPPSDSVSSQGYLPGDLYNLNSEYGSYDQLKACVAAAKKSGLKAIADIVVNHRCAQVQDGEGRWNQYTGKMNWGTWAITQDSEAFGGTGHRKNQENFTAAPNIDHQNDHVRRDICEWLRWMKNDVGFDGWRFDFVKGYEGRFTKEYVESSEPLMAFGEYWDTCSYNGGVLDYNQDAHRQRTVNWIDQTSGRCGAFDFTTKAVLQEAVSRREYWRLVDKEGRAPGLLGMWPSRSVSFIENHDTGSTLGHWPFPYHGVGQGYAYILTHPGTPTVFCDHLYDSNFRGVILSLMELRRELKIHSRSSVKVLMATNDVYAAMIDGGKLVMKIGPGHFDPHNDERAREWSDKWDMRVTGDGLAVWTPNTQ